MSGDNKKNIIYDETTRIRDNISGEVIDQDINRRVIRVPRTPDFLMTFTKHITYLEQLGKTDNIVLFSILSHYVGQKNLIFLSPQVRKKIASELELDISSVNKAIKNLTKKEILVIDNEGFMYLNPYLFGKGNWEDIRKLRQELIFEYDFESGTTQMIRNVKAQYIDQNELNKSHDVLETTEERTEYGIEQTIYIQESEEEQINHTTPKKTVSELELELIKEKNKALELQLKLNELNSYL